MFDVGSMGDMLLSKTMLFYVFCGFFALVVFVSLVLAYHWIKYAKETDIKYKFMQFVYVIGIIFITMVSFSFYLMID